MAGKDLIIGNLKQHFSKFESDLKQFICDIYRNHQTTDTNQILEGLDTLHKGLLNFSFLFDTNHAVLGKMGLTLDDRMTFHLFQIRRNKIVLMTGLTFLLVGKIFDDSDQVAACLFPHMYPALDWAATPFKQQQFTHDMLAPLIEDFTQFADSPYSPWTDIREPIIKTEIKPTPVNIHPQVSNDIQTDNDQVEPSNHVTPNDMQIDTENDIASTDRTYSENENNLPYPIHTDTAVDHDIKTECLPNTIEIKTEDHFTPEDNIEPVIVPKFLNIKTEIEDENWIIDTVPQGNTQELANLSDYDLIPATPRSTLTNSDIDSDYNSDFEIVSDSDSEFDHLGIEYLARYDDIPNRPTTPTAPIPFG